MELSILVILHTLGACVWVGGHLILSLVVAPKALRNKDATAITSFESQFEKIGIPALLLQIITGFRLAMLYLPISSWFDFSNPLAHSISAKLLLLLITVLLAGHARHRLIPNLKDDNIMPLFIHIVAVTVIGVLLLVLGLNFRVGIF